MTHFEQNMNSLSRLWQRVARDFPLLWNMRTLIRLAMVLIIIDVALLLAGWFLPLMAAPSPTMQLTSLVTVTCICILAIALFPKAEKYHVRYTVLWRLDWFIGFEMLFILICLLLVACPLFLGLPYLGRLAFSVGPQIDLAPFFEHGKLLLIVPLMCSFLLLPSSLLIVALADKRLAPPLWNLVDMVFLWRGALAPPWWRSVDRFLASRYPVLWSTGVHFSTPFLMIYFGIWVWSIGTPTPTEPLDNSFFAELSPFLAIAAPFCVWLVLKMNVIFTLTFRGVAAIRSGAVILEVLLVLTFLILLGRPLGYWPSSFLDGGKLRDLIIFVTAGACTAAGIFALLPFLHGWGQASIARKIGGVLRYVSTLFFSLTLLFVVFVFMTTADFEPPTLAFLLLMSFPLIIALISGPLKRFFYAPPRS